MSNLRRLAIISGSIALPLLAAAAVLGTCTPTTHAVVPAPLGTASSTSALEAVVDVPGPVRVETVVGADWEVPRSGLINLDHPKAKAAGLVDGPEPIVIAFHALHHPTAGLYLVDTGAERLLRDDPSHALFHGLVGRVMGADKIRVRTDTASWVAAAGEPVKGVFLTHLHADHISGMRDVPNAAAIYTGPGEATGHGLVNAVIRPVVDTALEGKGELHEWRIQPDPTGLFDGVVDIFGDGTVWALYVPGHTAGSTAYLARTPDGPVLFTGDACHTTWGWDNGVEPGTYSDDRARSVTSLAHLRAFVAKHPRIDVRVGHQLRPESPRTARP